MVKIYTKVHCPNCIKSIRLMDQLGIEFTEISLETTPGAIEKVISMGFQAAPVIVSGEESWGGFNEGKIRGLVKEDVWDF